MAKVYSGLAGFPTEAEQPAYYSMLRNIGEFVARPATSLLVAVDEMNTIAGAVVFFSDMKYYGSGGTATQEKEAAGFRLLAVDEVFRGRGIGKKLTMECIDRTRKLKLPQLIIHTTQAMQTAWTMYEKLGFRRSTDLDFMQGNLQVFGFRLFL